MSNNLLGLFLPFKELFKKDKFVLDHEALHLQHKYTVILLLTCSIVLNAYMFFGEPIKCISNDSQKQSALNTFCWVKGTYTLRLKKELEIRNYTQDERTYMTKYGYDYNQHRHKAAYPGLGNFQVKDLCKNMFYHILFLGKYS